MSGAILGTLAGGGYVACGVAACMWRASMDPEIAEAQGRDPETRCSYDYPECLVPWFLIWFLFVPARLIAVAAGNARRRSLAQFKERRALDAEAIAAEREINRILES